MFSTSKYRINKWEEIDKKYIHSFNKIETFNGFAFDNKSSLKPMHYSNSNFYENTNNNNNAPSNIYLNIQNKSDYYYSQPPSIPKLAVKSLLFK